MSERKKGSQDAFKALGLSNQKDRVTILEMESLPVSGFGIRASILKMKSHCDS